jgi:hypothetical protein
MARCCSSFTALGSRTREVARVPSITLSTYALLMPEAVVIAFDERIEYGYNLAV